jgi:predicted CoA-binding protein
MNELRHLLEESHDPENPTPEELRGIMETVRTIAVVGISRNPEKPARRVPAYLAGKGYEIIPVNPFVDRVLGKEAKDRLDEVPEPVDMVLVFRPSDEAAEIIALASARGDRPVIWLQEGIQADPAAHHARSKGFTVIQDLCAYNVHRTLHRTPS